MFIKLLKQFFLVGTLLFLAIVSLYFHTSINTDLIPEEYNAYALIYGTFGESSESDKENKETVPLDKEINILDTLESFSP